MKLPLVRLGEALEEIDAEFDATITVELNELDRAIIIWLLTNCKPNLRVGELRCPSYEDLYEKIKNLNERRQHNLGQKNYKMLVQEKMENCSSRGVYQVALAYGFDAESMAETLQEQKKT